MPISGTQNPTRDEEIVLMRLHGATLNEIGDKFGISRERVRQIVKRDRPEVNRLWFKKLAVDEITNKFFQGDEIPDICNSTGYHEQTIRKILRRVCPETYNNRKKPPGGKGTSKYLESLQNLSGQGYTTAEAARELGIHGSSVSIMAKKYNIHFQDGRVIHKAEFPESHQFREYQRFIRAMERNVFDCEHCTFFAYKYKNKNFICLVEQTPQPTSSNHFCALWRE